MSLTNQSLDERLGRRWRIYPVSISVLGLLSFLALSGTTRLCAVEPPSNELTNGYEIHWGLQIPTRNGTKLNATGYLPIKKEDGTLLKEPTVLLLTPYVSDSYHGVASYFAQRGYGFLLADCRGRGNSQGSFEPFVNDANDAYDAVEWIARQDFSNGKVTMWGGSYSGMNQWLAAKELPAHLAAIVPVAAVRPGYDFPNYRSLPVPYATQWLTLIAGVTVQHGLFDDNDFWIQSFYRAYQNCIPFRDLDSFIGNPSPIFQKWLQHPDLDSYWLSLSPTPEELAKITIPVLTITGQYDGDEFGDLSFYKGYLRAGAGACRRCGFFLCRQLVCHSGTQWTGWTLSQINRPSPQASSARKRESLTLKEPYDVLGRSSTERNLSPPVGGGLVRRALGDPTRPARRSDDIDIQMRILTPAH